MGAMVDCKQPEGIRKFAEAGKQAANLVARREPVKMDGTGCFLNPTIFFGVSHDYAMACHEIIGSVLSVIPFDT